MDRAPLHPFRMLSEELSATIVSFVRQGNPSGAMVCTLLAAIVVWARSAVALVNSTDGAERGYPVKWRRGRLGAYRVRDT